MPGLATKVWEETKRKSFCLAEAVCSRGPYGAPEEPYNAPEDLIMVLIMPEGLQVLYETHMDCLVLLSGLLFQRRSLQE